MKKVQPWFSATTCDDDPHPDTMSTGRMAANARDLICLNHSLRKNQARVSICSVLLRQAASK